MILAPLLRPGPEPAVGVPVARGRRDWTGQLARFGAVGGGASLLQLALYAFLADSIGAQTANVASWLVSTLVATEAHRRFSFGGSASRVEGDHLVSLVTSLLALLLSTVALAALDSPTGPAGVAALIAVNAGVGLLRFMVLRWWLIARPARSPATPSPSRSSSSSFRTRPRRAGPPGPSSPCRSGRPGGRRMFGRRCAVTGGGRARIVVGRRDRRGRRGRTRMVSPSTMGTTG